MSDLRIKAKDLLDVAVVDVESWLSSVTFDGICTLVSLFDSVDRLFGVLLLIDFLDSFFFLYCIK